MDTAVVGKMPTHAVIASTPDFKNKVTVGALWLKEGEFGMFLSGELKNETIKDDKKYPGYSIVEDSYLQLLQDKIKNLEAQIPKSGFDKAIDSAYEKPLQDPLYVKRDSHKRAHKLKIKHDKGTIDNLITDLMDTYEEVQRRK